MRKEQIIKIHYSKHPLGVEPWTFLIEQTYITQNRVHHQELPALVVELAVIRFSSLLEGEGNYEGALLIKCGNDISWWREYSYHATSS